ncbi:MAG: APC family permease [Thermoproteus sp. AZ2]|uniref:APC family permease n=1 Tax=Thermoproteus sp. AZ2 TaxID=1609232 RepID=A0ACC6V206_9CREN|nr:MAG: amino acid transporter [Thermoproteus sp. AZ2]
MASNVFLRKSSGLVKEAGLWDAVSINVANMSAGVALGAIGFTLSALPSVAGVNLVYASLIAFLLAVPQIIVYTILSSLMPRTGGDYVWLSRALGPRLAWLVNGLVMAFIIESLAYYALVAIAGVYQLQSVLPLLGVNASFGPLAIAAIAVAFFAVPIAANILGTKHGLRLMTTLTTLSIAGLALALALMLATPRPAAETAAASLLPSGYSYGSVAGSYRGPGFLLANTLMVLPFFALFVYPWLNAGPAIGSEIRGKSAVKLNVLVAALLTMTLVTLGFAAMYRAFGFAFTTAALANPDVNSNVNFWTLAMALAGDPALRWIIGITSVAWYLAVLAYGAIVIVRYWFALAFDRVWPSAFAYISPRFKTPIYAHAFDFAVTAALIAAASLLYNTFTALYGALVGPLAYYALVGIAAVAIAARRNGLGRGAKALLAIAGVLQAAVFAYLEYLYVAYPQIWGGNWLAYGVEIGAFALGVAAYAVARAVNLRKGIDISLAYVEIPPD